jgi:hypothetical protein
MKYYITMNKRTKYMRVYTTIKRVGEQQNALTKLFVKVFSRLFKLKENETAS